SGKAARGRELAERFDAAPREPRLAQAGVDVVQQLRLAPDGARGSNERVGEGDSPAAETRVLREHGEVGAHLETLAVTVGGLARAAPDHQPVLLAGCR